MAKLNTEAATSARQARNHKNPSTNFLSPDGDDYAQQKAGVEGERAVAEALGLEQTPIADARTKKGVNLTLPDGRTVNVATARKAPMYLPVAVTNAIADLYVLVHYREDTGKCHLIGWATREEVAASKQMKLASNKTAPMNYCVHVNALHLMQTLIGQVRGMQKSLF